MYSNTGRCDIEVLLTVVAIGAAIVLAIFVMRMKVKAPVWVALVCILGALIMGKSVEGKLIFAAIMLILHVATVTLLLLFFLLIDYAEYTRITREEGFWSFRKKNGVTWKNL